MYSTVIISSLPVSTVYITNAQYKVTEVRYCFNSLNVLSCLHIHLQFLSIMSLFTFHYHYDFVLASFHDFPNISVEVDLSFSM
jgi:hypothetical protein